MRRRLELRNCRPQALDRCNIDRERQRKYTVDWSSPKVCMRPSSAVVTHPSSRTQKLRKRRLQKADHRLHVTHANICMFKPERHCETSDAVSFPFTSILFHWFLRHPRRGARQGHLQRVLCGPVINENETVECLLLRLASARGSIKTHRDCARLTCFESAGTVVCLGEVTTH
jgi:hypothetical protein